jgi:DNA invertase Pin-like site-specific DNA recombinase
MEKVIGYARISSTAVKKGQVKVEGDNNSIEVQVKRIKDYCKFKELELVDILIDEDVSGGTEFETRGAGSKAIEYFDKGVKTIIATKIDRMFRDTADALLTSKKWNKQNIEMHFVDMGGVSFNTRTANGKFFFTFMVANAEYEKDITGERTKAVLNNKKETGKAYCAAVLGYDNVGGKMVRNEEEFKIIDIVFDLKSKGYTPARIALMLNKSNYRAKKGGDFFPSTIQAILKNDIYKMEEA